MKFSTLRGLTIPEGKVAKITDGSGRVLWSAVKMANLTITSFWDGMDGDTARIIINSPSPFAPNPNEPNNKVTTWTAYVYDLLDQQNRTIKIPVGSTIECYITRDKGNAESYIKLNNVNVATGEGTYVYTVTGDATIDVSEEYIQGDFGVISITGAVTYISFSINGETYQTIEGMTWNGWFASDYNTTGKTKGDVIDIKDANGNDIPLDSVIVGGTAYEVVLALTVTIKSKIATANVFDRVYVTINGQQYKAKTVTSSNSPSVDVAELVVPRGTTMSCYANGCGTNANASIITVNSKPAVQPTQSMVPAVYEYIINSDIQVVLNGSYMSMNNLIIASANIDITEIPEGQILFTIANAVYFADEGMTWGEWVNSAYNPEHSGGGKIYAVDGNLIRNNDDGLYVSFWGDYNLQSPSTPIVPNGDYYLTRD